MLRLVHCPVVPGRDWLDVGKSRNGIRASVIAAMRTRSCRLTTDRAIWARWNGFASTR